MIAALPLLLALSAAQDPAAPPPAAAEKKICRQTGPATGSLLNRPKECHTRAELAEIAKANETNRDRFTSARESNPGARLDR